MTSITGVGTADGTAKDDEEDVEEDDDDDDDDNDDDNDDGNDDGDRGNTMVVTPQKESHNDSCSCGLNIFNRKLREKLHQQREYDKPKGTHCVSSEDCRGFIPAQEVCPGG